MARLIIVGGARSVWEDFYDAPKKLSDVLCINYSAISCPGRVDHIASMHSNALLHLRTLRKVNGLNDDCETHAPHSCLGVDSVHGSVIGGVNLNGGSSGCWASVVALEVLGYDSVVLCGCPVDNSGNFYDPPWVEDRFAGKRGVWKRAAALFAGRVTSMSGWTRDYFGAP